MSDPKRIGIFGGSFDPIHHGHLLMAQDAVEECNLDRVVFIPALQSPLKSGLSSASPSDRLEMTRIAVQGDSRFTASSIEIEREGPSYSIDTIEILRNLHPNDHLFWMIGADQAEQLKDWRKMEQIARLIEFICFSRKGSEMPDSGSIENLKVHFCGKRTVEISSTEIRARLKNNLPIKYFLPGPVLDYITTKGLYKEG